MASHRFTHAVPGDLVGLGDELVDITFEWSPGTEPSGLSGPPENYDPGSADEFYVITEGITTEQAGRVIDYIDEHWERPEDGPDPDWLRDQRRDEEFDR